MSVTGLRLFNMSFPNNYRHVRHYTYHNLAQISIFLKMQPLIIVFVTLYQFNPAFCQNFLSVIGVICLFDCL